MDANCLLKYSRISSCCQMAFFGATEDGAAYSILHAASGTSRSRRDSLHSLHAVPRVSVRPAGSLEANRDCRGDSNWLLCWMPHSLRGGWMALGLFQQSNNLDKVMVSSCWRGAMWNGKPASHFSIDNSYTEKKLISAQQFAGTYVPLQTSYTGSMN